MPADTPKSAKSDAAADSAPDAVEQMADDVAAETAEYPEGAPEFVAVLKLPRMRRADAYEVLGQIQDQQRKVKRVEAPVPDGNAAEVATDTAADAAADVEVKPVELDPLSYGAQYRVIAFIERYLGVVAADAAAFAAWAGQVSDADLVKTFNVFIRTTQPGEAESSTG